MGIIKLTEEEREDNFNWMIDSYHNAKHEGIVQCRGCWEWFDLHNLFRCFHCGLYFCTYCSYKHFGRHPKVVITK